MACWSHASPNGTRLVTRDEALERLYIVIALERSKKALGRLHAIFEDVRESEFELHRDDSLLKAGALQRAVLIALLELQLAGQCQIERHVVPLTRYPAKRPLTRDDKDDEAARVRVAIEDGSIFYHGDAIWTAYRYLKSQSPRDRIQVFRNIFGRVKGMYGGCGERFFLETQSHYAALGGPSTPEAILRWVVNQDINHLLIVNSWSPDAERAIARIPERLAHTITFSAFARDYLRDLLAAAPLNDYPARWRRIRDVDFRCGCNGYRARPPSGLLARLLTGDSSE